METEGEERRGGSEREEPLCETSLLAGLAQGGARLGPRFGASDVKDNAWTGGILKSSHPYKCWMFGVFLYLYWSFFNFVSIRELFGMAGKPRSRPLGVESGPGWRGSEGVRGAPEP